MLRLMMSRKVQQEQPKVSLEKQSNNSEQRKTWWWGFFFKTPGYWVRLMKQFKKKKKLWERDAVILGHLLTARLVSQSPQCSELFSMFDSQSSCALLLWWRVLTKSICCLDSIFQIILERDPGETSALHLNTDVKHKHVWNSDLIDVEASMANTLLVVVLSNVIYY